MLFYMFCYAVVFFTVVIIRDLINENQYKKSIDKGEYCTWDYEDLL